LNWESSILGNRKKLAEAMNRAALVEPALAEIRLLSRRLRFFDWQVATIRQSLAYTRRTFIEKERSERNEVRDGHPSPSPGRNRGRANQKSPPNKSAHKKGRVNALPDESISITYS